MANAAWYDRYLTRVQANGDTVQDRTKYILNEGFQNLLKSSPNAYSVTIGTNSYNVIIQDLKSKEDTDDKTLISSVSDTITTGDIFSWNGYDWMVVKSDVSTLQVTNSFTIRKTNNTFKWFDKANNVAKSLPCIVKNFSLYTTGVLEGKYIDVGDGKLSVTLPDTEYTASIDRDMRFFINGRVYKITHVDNYSIQGLKIMTAIENAINVNTDDVANSIADRYRDLSIETVGEIVFEGDGKIYFTTTNQYEVYKTVEGVRVECEFDFMLSGESVATLNTIDGNNCEVVANSDFNAGDVILTATEKLNPASTANIDILVRGFI